MPSLGLFANVGGSQIFSKQKSNESNFSFGEMQNYRINIKDGENRSLRAFYFCLIELCYSPELPPETSSNCLRKLKLALYTPDLDGLVSVVPAAWLTLHSSLSPKKLLAEYLQIMDYNRGNAAAILNQYPILDLLLVGFFRRLFNLALHPTL